MILITLIFTNIQLFQLITTLYVYNLPQDISDEFCVDNTSLKVNYYNERGDEFYLYFNSKNGSKYEAKTVSNRSDHFPLFLGIRELQFFDDNLRTDQTGQYRFESTYNVYLLKQNNNWRLISFNQIWLGCPQPMCLHSQVDAAIDTENAVYIYRGMHYWILTKTAMTPYSSKAFQISADSFFDCGFSNVLNMYLIKESNLYISSDGQSWKKVNIRSTGLYSNVPINADAAVFKNDDNVVLLNSNFSIRGSIYNLWIKNIDAAISVTRNKIRLFKGTQFITVRITKNRNGEMNKELHFEAEGEWKSTAFEYFGCNYEATLFGNYNRYKQEIEDYFDGRAWIVSDQSKIPDNGDQTPSISTLEVKTPKANGLLDMEDYYWIITISLMILILYFCYLIAKQLRRRLKHKK